jgi:hypothetical protein
MTQHSPPPRPNLPAYRSIALRLPVFFALTLLGVAMLATLSITQTIRTQSLTLVERNLDTIATSQAQQIERQLANQISFLASFTNDENIQLQLITSNNIFEGTLKPAEEVVADWETVWANALREYATPNDSPFIQTTLRNAISQELTRRTFSQAADRQDGLLIVNKYGALFGTNYVPNSFDHS